VQGDASREAQSPLDIERQAAIAQAKRELIASALEVVRSLIPALRRVSTFAHESTPDLTQEVYLAVCESLEHIPEQAILGDYLEWCIRSAVLFHAAKRYGLSLNDFDALRKLRRMVTRHLIPSLGREPSSEEIVEAFGLPDRKVRALLRHAEIARSLLTPSEFDFDEHAYEAVPASRSTLDPASASANPLQQLLAAEETSAIQNILQTLTPAEARVLQLRFDIDGTNVRNTSSDVQREFEATRERIRQIETKALQKLSHPSRNQRTRGLNDR
jgi:RNA polymerase primary sigma factor